MAQSAREAEYSGEVWTDARGYATVHVRDLVRLHGNLRYELLPFTPNVHVEIAAELIDGRFTIATDEPHVKVAWRVHAQRPHSSTEEGT